MKIINSVFFILCIALFSTNVFGQQEKNGAIKIETTVSFNSETNLGTLEIKTQGTQGKHTIEIIHHYGDDYIFRTKTAKLKDLKPGLYIIIVRDEAKELTIKNVELGSNEK